jgi:hypothetical protein
VKFDERYDLTDAAGEETVSYVPLRPMDYTGRQTNRVILSRRRTVEGSQTTGTLLAQRERMYGSRSLALGEHDRRILRSFDRPSAAQDDTNARCYAGARAR